MPRDEIREHLSQTTATIAEYMGAPARPLTTWWSRSSRISGAPCDVSGSVSVSREVARARGSRDVLRYAALVILAIAITPAVAHAWTPGTHVFLGEAVMRSLALLPVGVAELLREFPYDFLYGSIAADTSIAKKYAPEGRHCHCGLSAWNLRGRTVTRCFRSGIAHLMTKLIAPVLRPETARRHLRHVRAGHSY
jgi:hypothetical protein